MKKLVDIYPYCITTEGIEFLLMKRSQKVVYAGQWRMIGGKVNKHETHTQAAIRELKEETGMYPNKLWVLPSINHFYNHQTDQIHLIPAFGAELGDKKITMNHEHQEYEWFSVSDALNKFQWPEQKRLMKLLNQIVKDDVILPEWTIPIDAYRE